LLLFVSFGINFASYAATMIQLSTVFFHILTPFRGMVVWTRCLLASAVLVLTACAGPQQSPVLETFKLGIANPNTVIEQLPLNPNYRYLKVDVNGLPALLVLGYQDQAYGQTTDVWFSAFKEVVQIQGGRLKGTQGLEVNWTEVQFDNAPSLTDLATLDQLIARSPKASVRFQRSRSVMPSYRANIQETVELRLLDSAPSDAPKVLKNSTTPFRWIEERVVMQTQVQNNYLAPLRAVYALDPVQGQVVYANQCLTQTVCISWLSWPFPAKPTQQVGAK